MSELRDYVRWHDDYDDPASSLSWRLGFVRDEITKVLDAEPRPLRVVSACAGDGRDILGALQQRSDAERVSVVLVELHPVLGERAIRNAADHLPDVSVEVRCVDAGSSDAYVDAVPADLVLLVGILGNLSEDDVDATIAFAPQLCAPGATLLWSRSIEPVDNNDRLRRLFVEAGFTELRYEAIDWGGSPAVGVVRYDGPPVPLEPGERVFTFLR